MVQSLVTMVLLLFVLAGIFQRIAASGPCNTDGIVETNKFSNHEFDLPASDDIVIGFRTLTQDSVITVSLSGSGEPHGQQLHYKLQDDWRFFRILEKEIELPSRSPNLQFHDTSLIGRKFTVTSREQVCWRMFLPHGYGEYKKPSSTPTQRVNPPADPCPETTTCATSKSTAIFLAIVCVLLALSISGLICYTYRLKKFTKSNGVVTPTLPDLISSTGFPTRRQNRLHNTENVVYNAPIR